MSDVVLLEPPSGRLIIADAGLLPLWAEHDHTAQLDSPPHASAWALDMVGNPAVAVQDLPRGRPVRVTRDKNGIHLHVRDDAPHGPRQEVGVVHIIMGPLLLLAPESLAPWSATVSHDGRADVIIEGPGAADLATRHGIPRAPDGQWIWRDLREGAAEMFAARAREAKVQVQQRPHTLPQLARNALTRRDLLQLHDAVALDVPAGVYELQLQHDIDQRIVSLHLHGDGHQPPTAPAPSRSRLPLAGTIGCVLLFALAALLALVALVVQLSP